MTIPCISNLVHIDIPSWLYKTNHTLLRGQRGREEQSNQVSFARSHVSETFEQNILITSLLLSWYVARIIRVKENSSGIIVYM